MVEVILVLLVVGGPSFVAGLTGHQIFGWLWASILVAIGLFMTIRQPDTSDQDGLALIVYGTAAAAAIGCLLAGFIARRIRQSRKGQRG